MGIVWAINPSLYQIDGAEQNFKGITVELKSPVVKNGTYKPRYPNMVYQESKEDQKGYIHVIANSEPGGKTFKRCVENA